VDGFGTAVSISGDVALVGAPNNTNANGTGAGAAYVYRRIGGIWSEEVKLIASDGATGDHFGNAVAIDGDLALVGAYAGPFGAGSSNIGCVYAYRIWTARGSNSAW
jgi:hypothetical protein